MAERAQCTAFKKRTRTIKGTSKNKMNLFENACAVHG